MVEESNVDGELKVLNHLLLDLLLPFHLDDQARAYGQTEVQHLLRKYWLPWLQEGGERGHFHVGRHLIRQIFAPFTRSARRSNMAFNGSAPSLKGIFGKCIELDAIQELYVLLVKHYMMAPGSQGLHTILRRIASSLHLPMTVIPELDRLWGNQRSTSSVRRWRAAEAPLVRRLGKEMVRCYLVPDELRFAIDGVEGSLGRMLRARRIAVRPRADALDVACFHYPHLQGGPPVVDKAAFLTAMASVGVATSGTNAEVPDADSSGDTFGDASEDDDEVLKALAAGLASEGTAGIANGAWLEGIEFGSTVAHSERRRDAHISLKSGRFRGYLRLRCGCIQVATFELEAHRNGLDEAHFAMLSLEAVSAGPWYAVRWMAAMRDSAVRWLRKLLPEGCLVVSLHSKAATKGEAGSALKRLVSALKEGSCLISRALSLRELCREAHKFAPLLRKGGVPGTRSASGGLRRNGLGRSTVLEERLMSYEASKPPWTVDGVSEGLVCYFWDPKEGASASVHAVSKDATAKTGLEVQTEWFDRNKMAVPEAMRLARSVEREYALEEAAKVQKAPVGKEGAVKVAKVIATARQWGDWMSPLPMRYSTTSTAHCKGDNRNTKIWQSFERALRSEHPKLTKVFDLLEEIHIAGDGFDYSRLVAGGKRVGTDENQGGDGNAGGGSGSRSAGPTGETKVRLECAEKRVQTLDRRLAIVQSAIQEIINKMWYVTHEGDAEMRSTLQQRWQQLQHASKQLGQDLKAADAERLAVVEQASAEALEEEEEQEGEEQEGEEEEQEGEEEEEGRGESDEYEAEEFWESEDPFEV